MTGVTFHINENLSRKSAASTALLVASALTLVDMLTLKHGFAASAAAFVVVYIALCWKSVRTASRGMLFGALGIGTIFLVLGGDVPTLELAASRALYLPALLGVMTLLRVAARRSRQVSIAARFVVDQPPSRRYVFLSTGAQVFGVLLSIGGYQLLLSIALAEREQSAQSEQAAQISGRRITSAIMRGFSATLMWSPVGLAMNLLLPVMPHLDWVGFLPYGIALFCLFTGLGWFFDRMGPKPGNFRAARNHEGARAAMLALVALLLTITGLAALAEEFFHIPMRAGLLTIIPLMAFVWVLLTEDGPPAARAASLAREGFNGLPETANEVCLLVSTGFLGLIVAQMIPPEALRGLVESLAIGPGLVAAAITLIIPVVSLLGISPMISGPICVGTVLAAGLPMAEAMLMVATLAGWAVASLLSPVTSSVVLAAAAAKQDMRVVGWKWNGAFCSCFLAFVVLGLLLWGRLI